jgi:hypothetical protein
MNLAGSGRRGAGWIATTRSIRGILAGDEKELTENVNALPTLRMFRSTALAELSRPRTEDSL